MTRLIPATLLALALAGCSRSTPEAPPEPETSTEVPARAAPPRAVPTAEPSPAVTANAAEPEDALPPPRAVGADEQMLDDASATGMTAHSTRDEEPAEAVVPEAAANEERP